MRLGRDGTLYGNYESHSCPFAPGRPVSRKAGKTETNTKAGKTNTLAIKGLLGLPTIESFTENL